jgi:hypothetical protein
MNKMDDKKIDVYSIINRLQNYIENCVKTHKHDNVERISADKISVNTYTGSSEDDKKITIFHM